MKRPLVISAIALIWGILLCDTSISHLWGILFLFLSMLSFILLYRPVRKTYSKFVLLAVPFLLTGYILHGFNKTHYQNLFLSYAENQVVVKGRIIDEPSQKKGRIGFILKPYTIDNVPQKKGLIQVSVYADQNAANLGIWFNSRNTGQIKIPQGKRNIGGFDYQKYLASREFQAYLILENP